MITIKNDVQIDKMRKAGELLHSVLNQLRNEIEPGVTTMHLDQMAEKLIRQLLDQLGLTHSRRSCEDK